MIDPLAEARARGEEYSPLKDEPAMLPRSAKVTAADIRAPGKKEVAFENASQAPRLWNADAAGRKLLPIVSGCLHYFPDALAAVSHVSHIGNQQHNPGQPMHWAQEKSKDHLDCIGRHLAGLGTLDVDGVPHSWKLAWRALANLQMELQREGAPVPPGAKLPQR